MERITEEWDGGGIGTEQGREGKRDSAKWKPND